MGLAELLLQDMLAEPRMAIVYLEDWLLPLTEPGVGTSSHLFMLFDFV